MMIWQTKIGLNQVGQMHRYRALLLSAILLGVPVIAAAAGPSFPSQNPQICDPSGRYAVVWKRGLDEDKPHHLFLKDLSSGRVAEILAFYRQADVLWSPDGQHVAVTDWVGSNVSEVIVFQPGNKQSINLADEFYHSLGKQPEIEDSDHVYFEAVSWLGPRKLLFKVFGHGAPEIREFEHFFEYDVSGAVRKVTLDASSW